MRKLSKTEKIGYPIILCFFLAAILLPEFFGPYLNHRYTCGYNETTAPKDELLPGTERDMGYRPSLSIIKADYLIQEAQSDLDRIKSSMKTGLMPTRPPGAGPGFDSAKHEVRCVIKERSWFRTLLGSRIG